MVKIFSGSWRSLKHAPIPENLSLYLYYGSRNAQPSRVLAFINLAVERLQDSPTHVLSAEELGVAYVGECRA